MPPEVEATTAATDTPDVTATAEAPAGDEGLHKAITEAFDEAGIEADAPDNEDGSAGDPELATGGAPSEGTEPAKAPEPEPAAAGLPEPAKDPEPEKKADEEKKEEESRALTEEELAAPEEYGRPGKEKLAARWNKVTERLKHVESEREKLAKIVEWGSPHITRLRAVDEAIDRTGADPQQLAIALEYLQAINSGDRSQIVEARNILAREIAAMDAALGETGPGSPNPLDGHADLKEAVENNEMLEEHARELALARNREGQYRGELERGAEAEQARAFNAVVQAESNKIEQADKQLMDSDPNYPKIRPILVRHLKTMVENNIPPTKWLPYLTDEYRILSSAGFGTTPGATLADPRAKPPAGDQAFLRTNAGVGVGKTPMPDPKSMEEAMDQALRAHGYV